MIIDFLIRFVEFAFSLFVLLLILNILFSYILDYYHPARVFVERIVGPLLNPIRRNVPPLGMFDLSTLILYILLYVLKVAIQNLLITLR